MKHCCLLKPIARGDGGHSQVSEFMVQEMRVETPSKTDDSELIKTAVHKCGFFMLRAPKCFLLYKSTQCYLTNTTNTMVHYNQAYTVIFKVLLFAAGAAIHTKTSHFKLHKQYFHEWKTTSLKNNHCFRPAP